jgi:Cu/Ag efflux protein CusF
MLQKILKVKIQSPAKCSKKHSKLKELDWFKMTIFCHIRQEVSFYG